MTPEIVQTSEFDADSLPQTIPAADVLDIFSDLQPGDRVLWEDRVQPCTVARIVEKDDRIGQSLTASVFREFPGFVPKESELRDGDVFLKPGNYGLTGRRFALIHGPRGGFYAIAACTKQGRTAPALFRAVRSYHTTKLGRPGQGAWDFDHWVRDGSFTLCERGDAPDELDPVGDLPAYADIKNNRVVTYDRDEQEHYGVATVSEVFDIGLYEAFRQAERESDDDQEPEQDDAIQYDDVVGGPDGGPVVTVIGTEDSEYDKKAVLDAPAPWDCPDRLTPANEVIKSPGWQTTHHDFDSSRKVWLIDLDTLELVASELRDAGYRVEADLHVLDGDDRTEESVQQAEAEREAERDAACEEARENLTDFDGVGDSTADALADAGFTTVQEIADADKWDLVEAEGIGGKTASSLIEQARFRLLDAEDQQAAEDLKAAIEAGAERTGHYNVKGNPIPFPLGNAVSCIEEDIRTLADLRDVYEDCDSVLLTFKARLPFVGYERTVEDVILDRVSPMATEGNRERARRVRREQAWQAFDEL